MASSTLRARMLVASLSLLLVASRAGAVLLFDGGAPEGNGSGVEVTIRVLANDFQLSEKGTVTSVDVWALVPESWDGTLEYFFFESAGNLPAAAPLATGNGTNPSQSATGVTAGPFTEYLFHFDLEQPLVVEAGQPYWFGLHLKQSFDNDGNEAYWSTTSLDFGETSRSAAGGDFGNWSIPPDDEAFRLYGEVPEPAAALQALAGIAALLGCRGLRRSRRSTAPGAAQRGGS
jgi:hypothetical protein